VRDEACHSLVDRLDLERMTFVWPGSILRSLAGVDSNTTMSAMSSSDILASNLTSPKCRLTQLASGINADLRALIPRRID
jgi:hypothetical protein